MAHGDPIPLTRPTRAIMIPEGLEMVLAEGTRVRITQALGGSFTVASERGNLFRIDPADADALGPDAAGAFLPARPGTEPEGDLEARVWAAMGTVFDPEIPVDVVALGLVYSCAVADGPGGAEVEVKMTLTAPGCGMGPVIADDVRQKVEAVPGVARARVEIVWDPPWDRHMISDAAKLELGLL
jgi:probable FeS assembly SUF system protein SufT